MGESTRVATDGKHNFWDVSRNPHPGRVLLWCKPISDHVVCMTVTKIANSLFSCQHDIVGYSYPTLPARIGGQSTRFIQTQNIQTFKISNSAASKSFASNFILVLQTYIHIFYTCLETILICFRRKTIRPITHSLHRKRLRASVPGKRTDGISPASTDRLQGRCSLQLVSTFVIQNVAKFEITFFSLTLA